RIGRRALFRLLRGEARRVLREGGRGERQRDSRRRSQARQRAGRIPHETSSPWPCGSLAGIVGRNGAGAKVGPPKPKLLDMTTTRSPRAFRSGGVYGSATGFDGLAHELVLAH